MDHLGQRLHPSAPRPGVAALARPVGVVRRERRAVLRRVVAGVLLGAASRSSWCTLCTHEERQVTDVSSRIFPSCTGSTGSASSTFFRPPPASRICPCSATASFFRLFNSATALVYDVRTLSSTLQYPKPRQMSSLFYPAPLALGAPQFGRGALVADAGWSATCAPCSAPAAVFSVAVASTFVMVWNPFGGGWPRTTIHHSRGAHSCKRFLREIDRGEGQARGGGGRAPPHPPIFRAQRCWARHRCMPHSRSSKRLLRWPACTAHPPRPRCGGNGQSPAPYWATPPTASAATRRPATPAPSAAAKIWRIKPMTAAGTRKPATRTPASATAAWTAVLPAT